LYYGALLNPIALDSIGAFTSAGTSTAQTMAALCLGVKLFEEQDTCDARGEPVVGARSALAPEKAEGIDRLVTLAGLALQECAGAQPAGPVPLLLCAPARDAFFDPEDLLRALLAEAPVAIDPRLSRAYGGGRTAIALALREAERLLSARACDACYVGGVESLVDREALDVAVRAGRVKTTVTPEGFVPGEGAVFLRVSARPGRATMARIAGIGEDDEPAPRGSAQPNQGLGLARAARAALSAAGVSMPTVGIVVHDASGDRFGFRESALALARLRPRAEPAATIWTPATVTGELGAAYGPLAVAQAAFFLQKQVSPGPGALVLGADAGPRRAAIVLSSAR
jgi:3-oxoacyl-[acyl-carrier-protein] synthase-1